MNQLKFFIIFFALFFLFACRKERIRNKLEGKWDVSSTASLIENGELIQETIREFEMEFFSDGTGWDSTPNDLDSMFYWTLTPDGSQIFLSQNITKDSFTSNTLFDIISKRNDRIQIWKNVEFFELIEKERKIERLWELAPQ